MTEKARQPCGQEWSKAYGATGRPHFTNRWGNTYTLDAIRTLVLKTRMVKSSDSYFEDVLQDVALAVWHRGARVEHAVVESLRRHGPFNRRGHQRLEQNALRLDMEIHHHGRRDPTIVSETVGRTDPNLDRIVADEPTLEKIKRVLSEREQFVVIGVLNDVTNKQLGERLGVSESRASQIFASAREKLFEREPPAKKPKRTWTDVEIVVALREWSLEHGRAPNTHDSRMSTVLPGASVVRERFGTWGRALEAAGLQDGRNG